MLDVAELAGEAAGRVAHAGEHREEDAHVAVRERDVADLDAEDVRVLAEDEVAAHDRGHEHHHDAQRFDERADDRVVDRDPHLAAVVLFGRFFELVVLGGLHGEGFDELDAAQRFGERFVDHRKLLHGLLVGALERFAEPMDRVAGERRDDERQQQQLPADVGGDAERQTMTLSGSSRAWPNRRCTPWLIELRSVVQRFMMSPRPDSVKLAMSRRSTLE